MLFCGKLLMFLLLVKSTVPLKKVWTASDDLANPNRWSPAKLPCPQDRVVLPKNVPYGINVPISDVVIKELQLPMDGTVTFEGLIFHDGAPTADCPGETIRYKENILHAWSDPQNWRTADLSIDTFSGKATPHLYKLPCVTDDVVLFEPNSLGSLPSRRQYVRSITVDDHKLDSSVWQSVEVTFMKNVQDDRMLYDPPAVAIVGDEYVANYKHGEPVCQENIPPRMCDYVHCKEPKCLEPFKPFYHCCPICGAQITVGTKKALSSVKVTVYDKLVDNLGVNVWIGAVSRNHTTNKKYRPTLYNEEWLSSNYNFYQILLIDTSKYNQLSTSVAKNLISVLKNEYNLIQGDEMLLSGIPWAGPHVSHGGWEALVMFFVILCAFLGVIIYHYPPSIFNLSHYSPFTFARFENRSRQGSLVQGISQLSLNKEFDNPMYRGHQSSDGKETEGESEDSDELEVEMESQNKGGSTEGQPIKEEETSFVKTSLSALLVKDQDDNSY